MNPKTLTIVRWKGLALIGTLVALACLYVTFFLDIHLKAAIEERGSQLNGAQVNVARLKTSLFNRTFELQGLEITDRRDPLRNAFEVDAVQFTFLLGPLLRRKLVVEDLKVSGVHYRTLRKVPGEQIIDNSGTPSLVDRLASGFYAEIRKELGENPFRNIGQLLTGLDLSSRVESGLNGLSSQVRINELRAAIAAKGEEWEKIANAPIDSTVTKTGDGTGREPASAITNENERLIAEQARLLQIVKKISIESHELRQQIGAVDELITKDVASLRSKLNLPRLDFDDLTRNVLGPALITQLEKLTYWVELSRKKMPVGSRAGQVTMVTQTRSEGTNVNFGKMAAFPAYLLLKGGITSELAPESNRGQIHAQIDGLTSDPPIYGHPSIFSLTANFPFAAIDNLKVQATIDHTGESEKESFVLTADSFPLDNFAINDAGDLTLSVKKARCRLNARAAFEKDQLRGTLVANVSGVQYGVTSRFKRIEETVRYLLSQFPSFTVEATIEGSFDKLKFDTRSELGRKLASGLNSEFKHQIGAIEDDLRKNILDQIYPQKQNLLASLNELEEKAVAPAERLLRSIQDLRRSSDQGMARLETGRKNSPSRRSKN